MDKIKITQYKSSIKCRKDQKKVLEALGLRKRGQSVVHNNIPQIKGMARKVSHLIKIKNVE